MVPRSTLSVSKKQTKRKRNGRLKKIPLSVLSNGLESFDRVSKSQYLFSFIIYKQDLQLVLVDNV